MRQLAMIELAIFKKYFALGIDVDFEGPRPAIGVNIVILSLTISWGREEGAPLFTFTNHWRSE